LYVSYSARNSQEVTRLNPKQALEASRMVRSGISFLSVIRNSKQRMAGIVSRLLDVPSTDPDDARRRKLLNILLLGMTPLTLLTLLVTIFASTAGLESQERIIALYAGSMVMLVGLAAAFVINRYWSGWLASSLFLLLVTAVVAVSDEPQEVAGGRSLLLFAVPIIMASVLLRPYASFIMASLVSLVTAVVAISVQIVPNVFASFTFFAIALVSWLSARSLERVLEDLRTINRELDQRVEDRTQALAEALSKNQAILEGIADGVIVFDREGKSVVANPAMARLLGRPTHDIMGRDIDTLMRRDVDATDQALVGNLLEDKNKSYPAIKLGWGDKTLSVSFAPVCLESGGVIGTVAVFRDFTREAEINRMKSAFVSIASHELRTPLNAILGYVDMLQEGVYGPLSEEQRNTLRRIVANTGHLLSLVSNLLDRAQIEAGTLTLSAAPFALTELIDSVRGVMDVLAHSKGLKLVSHIADDMLDTLFCDRQRLYQILINLVGNAIKFTDEGTVCMRAYRFDAEYWALEVSDTGRGIPVEAQSYIFEPFRQVDDSFTREHTGVGLGLSIVKQLADLMSGEITLKSEVGRGSTFTVVLPTVPPAWSQPKKARSKVLPQYWRSHYE
jgi:PAS domain S-box-containing protein